MIQIAVFGAAGRMGKTLIDAIAAHPNCELSAAIELPNHPLMGQDAGVIAQGQPNEVILKPLVELEAADYDVGIDFTIPEATLAHLETSARLNRALVVGTTGFSSSQREKLLGFSNQLPLVFAPNMSVGVNLSFKLIELAAKSMGEGADIEIIEAHHRNKVDAPSGTALKMGEVVADALGRDLAECAVYGREGRTGVRDAKTIGFETIRAGDIIGDHTVLFATEGETVEITHRATSRMNFAKGAVQAARWLASERPGLYDMQDVLGLKFL